MALPVACDTSGLTTTPSLRPGTAANADMTADSSVTSAATKSNRAPMIFVRCGQVDAYHRAAVGQQPPRTSLARFPIPPR